MFRDINIVRWWYLGQLPVC